MIETKNKMHIVCACGCRTEAVREAGRVKGLLAKAVARMQNRFISSAWVSWQNYMLWRKRKQHIAMRWKNPFLSMAFYGYDPSYETLNPKP